MSICWIKNDGLKSIQTQTNCMIPLLLLKNKFSHLAFINPKRENKI